MISDLIKLKNLDSNTKDDTNTARTYVTFINKNENLSIKPKVTVSDTSIYYSADNGFGESNGNWMLWDGTSTISIGKVVHMKGTSISKTLYSSNDRFNNTWMFYNDSDLKVMGDLCYLLCDDINDTSPTTYLGNYAFSYMFQQCRSLTVAPELSATTLASYCYDSMFLFCTSLTVAPKLPATTLANRCYNSMFWNCTSLTVAPELPATTLADSCYREMFANCDSLTVAPELLATTLATSCYEYTFNNCRSLTVAPELPATTLANNCYSYMFQGCKNLKVAPELPATTLASYCYQNMFEGCTSLTVAPELPATTLAPNCYNYMFYGCISLKFSSTKNSEYQKEYRIPKTGTINNAPSYWNSNMFAGTGGTFTGNPTINTTYYTVNTKVDTNTAPGTYVTFINKNENMFIIPAVTASDTSIYYSADNGFGESNGNWMLWDGVSTIDIGKVVHMKGTSVSKTLYSSNNPRNNSWGFGNTSDLKIIGDLCYLLCDDINDTSPTTYLGNYAFSFMFYYCDSLTVAPELSATTLAKYCYGSMFYGCTSLTVAPELPATTLATDCYGAMFTNCDSLTVAPELPATTLAAGCYNNMFSNCDSLTAAPELPATTLANNCYDGMFYNCTSLKFSLTKNGEYQKEYRIPKTGTINNAQVSWNNNMFMNTGGTFKGDPTINTTYYTENTIV